MISGRRGPIRSTSVPAGIRMTALPMNPAASNAPRAAADSPNSVRNSGPSAPSPHDAIEMDAWDDAARMSNRRCPGASRLNPRPA